MKELNTTKKTKVLIFEITWPILETQSRISKSVVEFAFLLKWQLKSTAILKTKKLVLEIAIFPVIALIVWNRINKEENSENNTLTARFIEKINEARINKSKKTECIPDKESPNHHKKKVSALIIQSEYSLPTIIEQDENIIKVKPAVY